MLITLSVTTPRPNGRLGRRGQTAVPRQARAAALRPTPTVSIARRFENSYEFEDIISFMNENGFYVFSFLTMRSRKDEVRQRYADVVFKRRNK